MFVHSVYFWLREDLDDAERDRFVRGVHSLKEIASVRHAWVGVPADTDRPIIERSYTYSLTAVFDGPEQHDDYQADPIHDRFRDECGDLWSRVLIYDAVGE